MAQGCLVMTTATPSHFNASLKTFSVSFRSKGSTVLTKSAPEPLAIPSIDTSGAGFHIPSKGVPGLVCPPVIPVILLSRTTNKSLFLL